MFWTLLALVSLVILGGFLAYYGDLQGRRWGKKRVSWFGLRPKHTAILITSLTGAFVSLLSIVTVLVAAPAIREVVLRGELAIREYKSLRIASENALRDLTNEKRFIEGELKEKENQLINLNKDVNAKKAEIEQVRRRIEELAKKYAELQRGQVRLEEILRQEQADLRMARATSQKLSKSNRELLAQNNRAEDFNKELGSQNLTLSRTNIELEQKNKTIQSENETLALNNADLKREGEELTEKNTTLTRTNEAILRANTELLRATRDQETRLAELKAQVAELTENEKALYNTLRDAGQSFTQTYAALRQGKLSLRAGGELARRMIPAHLRPEAVRRELLALLADASASAQRLGAERGENGRAVAIVRKRVVTLAGIEDTDEKDSLNALIENLTGSDKDIVVLANAINNSVAGEQVRIELTPRNAEPIFKKGQIVASRIINARQPVEKIADDLVEFLQKEVRDAAIKAGTIPQIEPETGTEQFGVAVPRDLVLLTDKVRRAGGRVRMEAVAAKALTSADLLDLTFRISRAE